MKKRKAIRMRRRSSTYGAKMPPDDFDEVRATYRDAFTPSDPRTEASTSLHRLKLLEQGLVEASTRRPDNAMRMDIRRAHFLAALARFGAGAA